MTYERLKRTSTESLACEKIVGTTQRSGVGKDGDKNRDLSRKQTLKLCVKIYNSNP